MHDAEGSVMERTYKASTKLALKPTCMIVHASVPDEETQGEELVE
jgi:hypothetical protein